MSDLEAVRELDLFNRFVEESGMVATDIILNGALLLEWEADNPECYCCIEQDLIKLNEHMTLLEEISTTLAGHLIDRETICGCEDDEDE